MLPLCRVPPTSPLAPLQIDTGVCKTLLHVHAAMTTFEAGSLWDFGWKEEWKGFNFREKNATSIRIYFLFKLVSLYYSYYMSALYFEREKILKIIEASFICKKIMCSGLGDRWYQLMKPWCFMKSQDLLHLSPFTTEKEQSVDLFSPPRAQPLTNSHLWLSRSAGRELHPLSYGSNSSARELSQPSCRRNSLWWEDFLLKR